jgi:hypothetical protein
MILRFKSNKPIQLFVNKRYESLLNQEGKIQMTSVLFDMGFDKHHNLRHSNYKLIRNK